MLLSMNCQNKEPLHFALLHNSKKFSAIVLFAILYFLAGKLKYFSRQEFSKKSRITIVKILLELWRSAKCKGSLFWQFIGRPYFLYSTLVLSMFCLKIAQNFLIVEKKLISKIIIIKIWKITKNLNIASHITPIVIKKIIIIILKRPKSVRETFL
jgi:hypothetical protein